MSEMRRVFESEKDQLKKEANQLREQLSLASTQLSTEQEKYALRLQDENDRHEKELQVSTAETLRHHVQMKADLMVMVQQLKNEDLQREANIDMRMAKYKESLVAAHAIEESRIAEKHKAELRRLQSELEVAHRDASAKTKHIHEQEMSRLLRENDKLQKIIIRNGGASLFSSPSTINDVGGNKSPIKKNIRQSHSNSFNRVTSTTSGTENSNRSEEDPPPPPPPPITSSIKLNWGAVKESINKQVITIE